MANQLDGSKRSNQIYELDSIRYLREETAADIFGSQWDGCRKETDYYEKSYGSCRNSDFRDVVVATLKLVNVPTEPKLPQTGDNANPLLYLGIGALALITGVGVGLRGRKKKNKQ